MSKPNKPYPDFPLTPHAKGWVKRHKGKIRFVCGPLPPDKAMKVFASRLLGWEREEVAQQSPPPAATNDVLLADLADKFLASKEAQLAEGMSRRTFDEYVEAVKDFCATVGTDKIVAHLTPADFQKHRLSLSERFGVHRLAKFQILVRSLFKWGVANEVLVRLPKYGTEYSLPAKRKFRLAEADREQKNGKLLFEPAEVKALLENCVNANMRAMILLALNGGYGQEDLASLPLQVIDLDGGVIDYRRSKTGMRRRVVLWPETVKAVRSAIPSRPTPAANEWESLVFLTRWGNPYVRDTGSDRGDGDTKHHHKDQVGMQFLALCKKAGCYRPGRNFYSLRRTFRTYADECRDQRAVALIMGHETGDVADLYVERIGDDRLKRITDHVRAVVLSVVPAPVKGKSKAPAKRKAA